MGQQYIAFILTTAQEGPEGRFQWLRAEDAPGKEKLQPIIARWKAKYCSDPAFHVAFQHQRDADRQRPPAHGDLEGGNPARS